MKDSLSKAGYNLEEIYFYQLNQKLIENIKKDGVDTTVIKNQNTNSHLRLVVDNVNPNRVAAAEHAARAAPQVKPKKKAA
jgi:hypothetical protein